MKKIIYKGNTYFRSKSRWLDENYLTVPDAVSYELDRRYQSEDLNEILASPDTRLLLKEAGKYKEEASRSSGDMGLHRAERVIRRLLEVDPENEAGAAVLSSILRARKRPLQGLKETERFVKTAGVPLLTSRAAAHCDLNQWDEANKLIEEILAKAPRAYEARLVAARIAKARAV
jgi:tetratricopeptide (TPR) repeat protein